MPPNANRVGEIFAQANFGLIEIDWEPEPSIRLQARDLSGRVRIERVLALRELRPAR